MSAFATITAAIAAKLAEATAVSSNIYRARMRPVGEQFTDAIVVRPEGGEAQRFATYGAPVDWQSTWRVECYARASASTPDAAVDTLLGAAYARLAADPTLGGAVIDMNVQRIDFDFAEEAQDLACGVITYLVQHRTGAAALT